ncbi:BLUF domain-containing protein [Methylobacterium sp. E-016]|uniref:BLUF domain-containing protein n=1 Tax=Methylobacterium sp. E-016 TaxID=2836556 RepID=UPI001FB9FECD|nr:BLUF domain-containing protein [Methylobacterium sp. E-016]MCJ2078787.1 BLUF domain-containing protein [Methylobacterium sp. E-016]
MFNAGAFAQVLEGPRRQVEETFERIQCDDRHGDVTADADGFLDQCPDMVGREHLPTRGHTDLLISTQGDDLPRCPHEQSYHCVIRNSTRSSDDLHKVHLYQTDLVVPSRFPPLQSRCRVFGPIPRSCAHTTTALRRLTPSLR